MMIYIPELLLNFWMPWFLTNSYQNNSTHGNLIIKNIQKKIKSMLWKKIGVKIKMKSKLFYKGLCFITWYSAEYLWWGKSRLILVFDDFVYPKAEIISINAFLKSRK